MRNGLLVVSFTCLLTAVFGTAIADENRLLLRDGWTLRSSTGLGADGVALSQPGGDSEGWLPTTVPSTVLAALVDNGVYPDPYYGDNLKKIPGFQKGRWLVMEKDSPFYPSWWYRTEFKTPAHFAGKQIVLHLDGINMRANVWLNGQQLADDQTCVGMFRRFEFDVDKLLRPGEANALAIEITAPGHLPEKSYRSKQVEATTGWDDHNPQPPDLNMGLWRDVYLTATGSVALRHAYVDSGLDLPGLDNAHLTVEVHAVNKTAEPITGMLSGAIESIAFSQEVVLRPNETKVVRFTPDAFEQLNVANPRVWWPCDLGAQELYDATLSFSVDGAVSDTAATRFGIRDADTYINDEGWRGYRINGKNVLIRGGAWMTSDMMLRLTHGRYEALVRYAREGHLNMLRSEGFSIRETEDFYNLCDELGVMVTQQIFGRSIPDEDLAIACIEDMMLRVRTHPSLVHFLGHDETFPTERLDKAYRDLIRKHSVRRTYQPHSGAFDIEDRFKTGGTRTGSLQVWTYAPPNHYYVSPFTGAWGFAQSGGIGGIFAPIESLRRMMPEDALWPPWSETWSFHTVAQGAKYFNPVLDAIRERYGEPTDIDDLIRKGSLLNYASARGMFEAYGRNKFSALGITTWKYDAAWPAAQTWQYIDYYLNATAAYHGAKKACEPLHVQYAYDDQTVYVVNNHYRDWKGLSVSAKVYDIDLKECFSKVATLDVPANGVAKSIAVGVPEGVSTAYFVSLKLETADGKPVTDNFYWLSTKPDIGNKDDDRFRYPESVADLTGLNDLPAVKLDATVREVAAERVKVAVANPSENLALFIRLTLEHGEGGPVVAPAYWDENYFALLPGERREVVVRFPPQDWAGAAPSVKVDGWNIEASRAVGPGK
ncbi:MAG: hypothetical protein GWP08_13810 [Nitrospiraceae bacterium]|nr:hypothetical protein [Nitrospiraceae bacterium]